MADEFLTQELPAIRRAQERSLVALQSMIWLVQWGLWRTPAGQSDRGNGEQFPIALEGEISALGSKVKPNSIPSKQPASLHLATFAVCLDAIDSIAEARGILSLPGAKNVRKDAQALREGMIRDLHAVASKTRHTDSRPFGIDDPLTASLLIPILRTKPLPSSASSSRRRPPTPRPELGHVSLFRNVHRGVDRLLSPKEFMIRGGSDSRTNTAEEHAWPVSLAVRALNLVMGGEPKLALRPADAEALRVWSEQEVRLQLARSVTGEAGQDAAHLAAAIAAAMWLEELPLPLLEAAIAQLCTMQRPDGSMVLTRPYLADSEGSVILPAAADVTLTMIAVADQLEARYPEHPTVLRLERQLLEVVQRQRELYFRTSMRRDGSGPSGEEVMVWSSARARPSPGRCDIWATARTVTALVMVLNLESRLLTRRLLDESRFSYRRGEQVEKGFDALVDPQLGRRESAVSALRKGLAEPDPHSGTARAVLLCGPPGTSKTSLIEAVAKHLADDLVKKQLGRYVVYLVQLSPADFLLDGPNRVEHRAKRIFDYLTEMENVVVLFDEIDRLILDRDSDEYGKQESVFQFMTPSMLPKLTALRQRGEVVRFAIATNYAERIDAAIARKGRIDESFVIPPPNLDARVTLLEERKGMDLDLARQLADVTPLWVYGDLKTLPVTAKPRDIMLQRPSGRLASYTSRCAPGLPTSRKEILAHEILKLAELYLEGRGLDVLQKRGPDEVQAIEWAFKNASTNVRQTAAKTIKQLMNAGVELLSDEKVEVNDREAPSSRAVTSST